MKKVIVDGKAVNVDKTKTIFLSKEALSAPVPIWAKNVFKLTVVLTTVIAFWVGGTNLIQESYKVEVMLGLKSLDALVLGVSRLFGVELKS